MAQLPGTIASDDPPPTFAISDASDTAEGGGLVFFVKRTGDLSQTGSISYTVNGADAGSVVFKSGSDTVVIIVFAPEDSVIEEPKSFTVELTTNTLAGLYGRHCRGHDQGQRC